MTYPSTISLYANYGMDYDRLQPLRIEMYKFYHELALDFMPFPRDSALRMLDLGCGTGIFMHRLLGQYSNAWYVGIDYSHEMLAKAQEKLADHNDRVLLIQRDLNQGLPEDLGKFQFISAFSALHHLTDTNKARLLTQIYDTLLPDGWFFFIDAMSVHFDDDVFRLGRQRQQRRLAERFAQAGIDLKEALQIEALNAQLDESSPEIDRFASLGAHLTWLKEAGFRSVDYLWHYWMEHFIIARK